LNRVYSKVLQNELFPKSPAVIRPDSVVASVNSSGNTGQARKEQNFSSRLLSFHIPLTERIKAARRIDFGSPIDSPGSEKYSVSPVKNSSQHALQSPTKPQRFISKVPFKVLDAPDLADDFYLNLVDWGSTNILGVGLASCVYLWSACTSRVTKLCDIGPYDSVTSVSWIQKVFRDSTDHINSHSIAVVL
jgi:cell division cycle 20-like protein 1 (cofactor of APC complex)